MDSKKPLIIVIVLLVLIIFGLTGFIVYEKVFLKTDTEDCKTIIDDVSIDVNKLYKVEDILSRLDKACSNNDSKYIGYIYPREKLEIKDFDKSTAIYISIYSDIIRSNTDTIISSERIKTRYEMIFGKALEYKPTNLDLGDNISIKYDDNNKVFKYKATIINNEHKDEYLVKNIKTKLTEDLVIVTRKVFYVVYGGKNATIYVDSSKTTKLGEVNLKNGEVNISEVVGKYGSKINTYEFTFKLGSDDEYNLFKIERTK